MSRRRTASAAYPRTSVPTAAPSSSAPSGLGRNTILLWGALLLAVAALVVYANSLGAPKVLDDVISIDQNRQIRELWSASVLTPERESPLAGRPLVNLTFALNYAVGGLEITGYRVVNLLIHILCSIMVMLVVRRALQLPSAASRWPLDADLVACATALIWLLHPLNSEVIDYVTQRTESMMALAYLGTLYAALRALDSSSRRWTGIAITSCLLGTLCKESMATAPLIIALFDRLFVFHSWRDAWHARRRLYLGLASSWILLAALLSTGPRVNSAGFNAGMSSWTYLLNQAPMLVRYLRLAVWPDALVVFYGPPQPLSLADVLPAVFLISLLLGMTLAALRYKPWLGFAAAWFFITLAPTSSTVPIVTEVGAERRMYLPLLAMLVPLCAAVLQKWESKRLLIALVVVLAVALGTTTAARNREYGSSVTLARVTLERWPTGAAHHMLGEQLLLAGNTTEALPHLREAIVDTPRAHYTLGMLLYRDNQPDAAVDQLQTFIRKEPLLLEVPEAHFTIAKIHAAGRRWAAAEAELRQTLAKAPGHLDAWGALARVYFEQEKTGEAIPAYRRYLSLQPRDSGAWTNLGICLAADGRLLEAIEAFRRAVDLAPQDGQAYRNLATALLDAGRSAEAFDFARRAVALRPNDPVARALLERARGAGN